MGSISKPLARNPRPRLLHNWGAALLTIAQKTYHHAEHFHGPVGSITRTLASTAAPILHPMQRQWLSILAFIDDRILSVEDLAMTFFPPSSYLFSMVDKLALLAESFPEKYDNATDGLSSLIQRLLLFKPVFKPCLSKMGSWEWSHCKDEITVDIKHDEQEKKMVVPEEEGAGDGGCEVVVVEKLVAGDEKKLSEKEKEEIREVEETCKDIIEEFEKMGMVNEEKGVGGDEEKGEEGLQEEVQVMVEDPILDLLDEGWGVKKSGV